MGFTRKLIKRHFSSAMFANSLSLKEVTFTWIEFVVGKDCEIELNLKKCQGIVTVQCVVFVYGLWRNSIFSGEPNLSLLYPYFSKSFVKEIFTKQEKRFASHWKIETSCFGLLNKIAHNDGITLKVIGSSLQMNNK